MVSLSESYVMYIPLPTVWRHAHIHTLPSTVLHPPILPCPPIFAHSQLNLTNILILIAVRALFRTCLILGVRDGMNNQQLLHLETKWGISMHAWPTKPEIFSVDILSFVANTLIPCTIFHACAISSRLAKVCIIHFVNSGTSGFKWLWKLLSLLRGYRKRQKTLQSGS